MRVRLLTGISTQGDSLNNAYDLMDSFQFSAALTDSCVIRTATPALCEYILTVEASGVVDARDRKSYMEVGS